MRGGENIVEIINKTQNIGSTSSTPYKTSKESD